MTWDPRVYGTEWMYLVRTAQCTAQCTAWYTALWRLCSIPILGTTILRLLFLVLIMEDNNGSIALRKKGKLESLFRLHNTSSLMLTKLFTSKATYLNNIVIPLVALRHPTYYNS